MFNVAGKVADRAAWCEGPWDGEEHYLLICKFFAGVVRLRNAARCDRVCLFCVGYPTATSGRRNLAMNSGHGGSMNGEPEINALGELVPSFEGGHLWRSS